MARLSAGVGASDRRAGEPHHQACRVQESFARRALIAQHSGTTKAACIESITVNEWRHTGMEKNSRTIEVQSFIDGERFSPYQWVILILCFLVVAADGFDTAAVGFIAPSLI